MNDKTLIIEDFIPYHLVVAADKVSRSLSKVYAKYNLTIPEWRILVQLQQTKELTHSELMRATNMEKARVSRALILMQKKQLIKRKPDQQDKRVVHIQLSEQGRALYTEIEPEVLKWNENFIQKNGQENGRQLLNMLREVSTQNYEV